MLASSRRRGMRSATRSAARQAARRRGAARVAGRQRRPHAPLRGPRHLLSSCASWCPPRRRHNGGRRVQLARSRMALVVVVMLTLLRLGTAARGRRRAMGQAEATSRDLSRQLVPCQLPRPLGLLSRNPILHRALRLQRLLPSSVSLSRLMRRSPRTTLHTLTTRCGDRGGHGARVGCRPRPAEQGTEANAAPRWQPLRRPRHHWCSRWSPSLETL